MIKQTLLKHRDTSRNAWGETYLQECSPRLAEVRALVGRLELFLRICSFEFGGSCFENQKWVKDLTQHDAYSNLIW